MSLEFLTFARPINKNIFLEKILLKPFTPSTLYNTLFENNFKELLIEEDMTSIKTKGKVLLVEDNETNQIVASKNLERYGLIVDIAINGQEALEMYAKTNYDMIFMDLQMPIMDGFTALEKIKEFDINAKVVIISADIQKLSMEKALKLGAFNFIKKPIDSNKMKQILEKIK